MQSSLPSFFLQNQSLKDKTYYKMGGIARYFAVPQNINQIQESLFWCQKNKIPCSVLGSGSNSIYADEEFKGLVISLEKLAKWFWETDEFLFVEAGVTNTEVSEICMAANRGGASWMHRMPGQMGASIRMNARCYGGEISQIVNQILTIDTNGILKTYLAEDVFKGYKSTLLMNVPEIVIGARLHFPHVVAAEKLIQHMLECEADRHKKRHFYMPSCGSTFKNNYSVGRPSGQVFDELGFKGYSVGSAEVSQFHANFIWNKGHALTSDFLNLTAQMRKKAFEKAHAVLELEVQPVGLFSQDQFENCGMEKLGPSYKAENEKSWVGLLFYPDEKLKEKKTIAKNETSFPFKIFDSSFIEYSQTPLNGCTSVGVQILQQIPFEIAKNFPDKPFLEWQTYLTEDPQNIFLLKVNLKNKKNPQNKFVDELWQYSVSEIFFADSLNPHNNYLEFEMTPNGEWVAIEFMGVRQRSNRNEKLTKNIWNNMIFNNLCHSFYKEKQLRYIFGMTFTYAHLEKLLKNKNHEILIQCALSLGNSRYYLAPYWKHEEFIQKHDNGIIIQNNAMPNFHQPEKYWKIKLF
ncbi:UDP-N-acetylmuramate dehydrogenase [Silvanigrella aquatica]|uniref:UDP-N-acetylenolpyruvoylglucosamine reductase n=1 Tax=Silvanigrella aquatica TaxID=1915309 RepID=A0A1L4CYZ1_9BACT|nr:UDP-N-acetylmuramate dehydrogenase [Silvanigrella aquatica]APJ03157.1 UDP-N-acetylenolpyruvoylglucosamine reductase [Silvanigrella aquatica]